MCCRRACVSRRALYGLSSMTPVVSLNKLHGFEYSSRQEGSSQALASRVPTELIRRGQIELDRQKFSRQGLVEGNSLLMEQASREPVEVVELDAPAGGGREEQLADADVDAIRGLTGQQASTSNGTRRQAARRAPVRRPVATELSEERAAQGHSPSATEVELFTVPDFTSVESPQQVIRCSRCGSDSHPFWTCPLVKSCSACSDPGKRSPCGVVVLTVNKMKTFAASGRVELLRAAVQELKDSGHTPSSHAYMLLLTAHVRRGEAQLAQQVLDTWRQDGLAPDAIAFNAVLNGWIEDGKLVEAVRLLETMRGAGIRPISSTYNTLIKGLGLAGRPADATQVLGLMATDPTARPNIRTYNILLNAWCQEGNVLEARKLMGAMRSSEVPPDVVSYNTLVKAYGQRGRPEGGEAVVAEMDLHRVRPNQWTCGIVVKGYCQQGEIARAHAFISKMAGYGVRPNAAIYNMLIKGYADSSMVADAEEVLDTMAAEGVPPEVSSYSIVMNAWSCAEAPEHARRVFDRMLAAGVRPDVEAYSVLVKGYHRAKRGPEAEAVLAEMRAGGVRPNVVTYTTIVACYCSSGRMDDAARVLREMRRDGVEPNVFTYRTLVWGFSEAKQPRRGEEVLAMMEASGLPPDAKCYDQAAVAWQSVGLWKESQRVSERKARALGSGAGGGGSAQQQQQQQQLQVRTIGSSLGPVKVIVNPARRAIERERKLRQLARSSGSAGAVPGPAAAAPAPRHHKHASAVEDRKGEKEASEAAPAEPAPGAAVEKQGQESAPPLPAPRESATVRAKFFRVGERISQGGVEGGGSVWSRASGGRGSEEDGKLEGADAASIRLGLRTRREGEAEVSAAAPAAAPAAPAVAVAAAAPSAPAVAPAAAAVVAPSAAAAAAAAAPGNEPEVPGICVENCKLIASLRPEVAGGEEAESASSSGAGGTAQKQTSPPLPRGRGSLAVEAQEAQVEAQTVAQERERERQKARDASGSASEASEARIDKVNRVNSRHTPGGHPQVAPEAGDSRVAGRQVAKSTKPALGRWTPGAGGGRAPERQPVREQGTSQRQARVEVKPPGGGALGKVNGRGKGRGLSRDLPGGQSEELVGAGKKVAASGHVNGYGDKEEGGRSRRAGISANGVHAIKSADFVLLSSDPAFAPLGTAASLETNDHEGPLLSGSSQPSSAWPREQAPDLQPRAGTTRSQSHHIAFRRHVGSLSLGGERRSSSVRWIHVPSGSEGHSCSFCMWGRPFRNMRGGGDWTRCHAAFLCTPAPKLVSGRSRCGSLKLTLPHASIVSRLARPGLAYGTRQILDRHHLVVQMQATLGRLRVVGI